MLNEQPKKLAQARNRFDQSLQLGQLCGMSCANRIFAMNQKANLLVGFRSNQPFTKLSMLLLGTGMFISIALGGPNESGGSSLSTKPESYPNSPAGNPAPTATALKSPSA